MVSSGRRNRRGSSTTGCLFTLLLFVIALYYGSHIGMVYWRYFELREEMRSQARLAPSLSDDVIRSRLLAFVEEKELPDEARDFEIERRRRPRAIIIRTEYRESVDLPLFKHTFEFRPYAEEPL